MEEVENHMEREILRMEVESRSSNEEFARVAVAVFMSRLDPTMEEIDDVKTAVSEAVTNAVIHGYQGKDGIIYIQVAIEGQLLSVEIRDLGVGIRDVEKAMEPMYTTDTTGERSGMGFSFMGSLYGSGRGGYRARAGNQGNHEEAHRRVKTWTRQ